MDRTTPRRQNSRLLLGIEAEFIGMDGPEAVMLQDLSATGAKLQFAQPHSHRQGFLRWMRYEVFGDIVWIKGAWCGIQFDRPISQACLLDTRSAAPGLIQDAKNSTYRDAEAFVKGSPR